MKRFIAAGVFAAVACLVPQIAAFAACDATIYALDVNANLYTFTPPTYSASQPTGKPVLQNGTILRGVYTGYVYQIPVGTTSNSPLYAYNPVTQTNTQVGTFGNSSGLYAGGFGVDGYGYVMSSSEVWKFTDAATPTVTKLGAPAVASGPALSNFNGGDLAVDANNIGWTVLSSTTNGYSYLYKVVFGTSQTQLTQATLLTYNGKNYTTGDLYSLAFGTDGTLYASSGTTGTLYSINQTSGAMTSLGSQGVDLYDFASCPFAPFLTLAKTGPSQSATGDLMAYSVVVSDASNAVGTISGLTLSDPVPAGITVLSATCVVSGGATCSTPAVAQTVTTTVSTPPGGKATLTIFGKDASLSVGTTTNTATLTSTAGLNISASAATAIVANTVSKTVADITSGGSAVTQDTAKPGDTLEYTLTYTNLSGVGMASFTMKDSTPAHTTFVSASCVTPLPSGISACNVTAPSVGGTGNVAWAYTGTFATGSTASFKLRVKVN